MNGDHWAEEPNRTEPVDREMEGFDLRWEECLDFAGPGRTFKQIAKKLHALARRPLLAEIEGLRSELDGMGEALRKEVEFRCGVEERVPKAEIRALKLEANLTASRHECGVLRERAEKAEAYAKDLERANCDLATAAIAKPSPGFRVVRPVTLRALIDAGITSGLWRSFVMSSLLGCSDVDGPHPIENLKKQPKDVWQFLLREGFVAEDEPVEVRTGWFVSMNTDESDLFLGPFELHGDPDESKDGGLRHVHGTITIQRHQEGSEG